MLTQDQVDSFRANGFLNFGPVLSPARTDTLLNSLNRVLRGDSDANPDLNRNLSDGKNGTVTQVVNIWQADPEFRRHLFDENIVPMIGQLMGADTVRVWHDQIQIKPPLIGGPTVWHQDHPYWPVIEPADLVSAWVALEDATIENGCMSMVRRSHKWGHYSEGTIGNKDDHSPDYDPSFVPAGETVEVVPCEVKAGSVVFHHCLTWHGAPPNKSERNRPAIAVHYMPGWTKYVPKGREHAVEGHIEVAPGEVLVGEHFPTVMESGRVVSP